MGGREESDEVGVRLRVAQRGLWADQAMVWHCFEQ